MKARLEVVRIFLPSILLVPLAAAGAGQAPTPPAQWDALVTRAFNAEVIAAQDTQHPMKYRLRKTSPRLTTTKEIYETKDGAVARLVAMNDGPLNQADEQKEQARLDLLLSDPSRQRHRKQSELEDANRALKVLRALPNAFLYRFSGDAEGPTGKIAKFTFRPNPKFDPPDLETQVLTALYGEIWVDVAQERVIRLEGQLQQDVDFGWGILGRLNKGGWIVIEQADVGDHQWRLVHFKMSMSGRVLFKDKVFDTTEDEARFAPLAIGLSYKQAVQMLRAEPANPVSDSH
jgi:hypothetical protein